MYQSSYSLIKRFRNLAEKHFQLERVRVLDLANNEATGIYKKIFLNSEEYDYVDYLPADPYAWKEFKDETFDVIVSGQAFEYIEFPWLIIKEMKKKLKKNGLICIVAPSRGPEHKYPGDCWRYYPDGFRSLAKWADLKVIEAKTCGHKSGLSDGNHQWESSFCILWKDENESPCKRAEPCSSTQRDVNKNNPLESGKTASYYSFARNEIIDAIEKNGLPAKRILEIGCAGGATGKQIKGKMSVDHYVGVEICEKAAGVARQHLDRVIVADIEKTNLGDCGVKYGDFDLLLALDVLEHLYNPWDVLAGLKKFLCPGGYVIASIPNIQNISIVNSLIHGKWRYESAGILDATHVRFFTMEEIERLFSGAAFSITKTDYVLNPPIDLSKIKDSGNSLSHENINLTNLSREDFLRLFVYQYIIIAKSDPAMCANEESAQSEAQAPALSLQKKVSSDISEEIRPQILFEEKEPVRGLVTIVILTFNQLKYTKECIESIKRYTPEPHQIIFVDNGSTDGTVKWLRQITEKNSNYRLIENKKNCGFAQGCNQGIRASSSEYILLLNNDVVVTEGWLSGMLACLNNAPAAGIIGPMTNNISGPQKVTNANYASMDRLHEYARTFREINRHRCIPFRRIVGFCMLFRRKLAEKIGLLDESFGSGNFEDDDFSLRAALEGYRNFIAGDVFIHHYGSRSFIGNKINYCSSMGKNKKIFDEKWRNIDASSPIGKKLVVLKDLELAERLYHRQQIDQAIPALIDGIKYSPDDKAIYYRLAEMLVDSKRFNDAVDALNSMPKGGKKEARWHALAGYGKEGMEFYAEAGEHADQALSLNAGCALALNLKGILAYKKGDKNSADDYFGKAIGCDPGYGEPYTNLGILKWAQGDREDAVNLLEKGVILSPTIADIVSIYHSAITSVGEFERAEQRFQEAKASYPLNKKIAFLLIDILLKQGKNEIAMQEIEQSMIAFGIDDGILAAALEVRNRIGAKDTDKSKKSGTLSVCMIVKNEEDHIARCLMSAQPVADEMIVVDTGSTDRTRDIAAAFGARVFEFPWTGDFSEARNFSLIKASGDWIFILDADEVISSLDYDPLKSIILKKGPQPAAYEIASRNYVSNINTLGWTSNKGEYPLEEAGTGWFPSVKARLFPNDGRIRFKGHVHELVESSIITAGIKIKSCRIIVHHYGKMNTGKLISKGEAYYLLGRKKLKELPGDVNALSELASQAQELKRFEDAIALWKRAIDLTGEKPAARFFFNLGYCYLQIEQYEKAVLASKKAMEIDPDMKEALVNYSYSELLAGGDYKKVISGLEPMLERAVEYSPASLLLAAAYCIAGKKDKAVISYKSFSKKGIIFVDSQNILCKKLIALGKTDSAVRVLEALIESGKGNDETGRLLNECTKQGLMIP